MHWHLKFIVNFDWIFNRDCLLWINFRVTGEGKCWDLCRNTRRNKLAPLPARSSAVPRPWRRGSGPEPSWTCTSDAIIPLASPSPWAHTCATSSWPLSTSFWGFSRPHSDSNPAFERGTTTSSSSRSKNVYLFSVSPVFHRLPRLITVIFNDRLQSRHGKAWNKLKYIITIKYLPYHLN